MQENRDIIYGKIVKGIAGFYYVYVARVVAPRSHYVIICISSAKCQNASHRIKEWQEEAGC